MKNSSLLIFFLFLAFYMPAQTNTDISNYSFSDSEPSLVTDPHNAGNVIAAWMKVTGVTQISIATSYSHDGGVTWSSPAIQPHLWTGSSHADVNFCYSNNGTAYMSYIDYSISADTGFIVITKSSDGGQTWSVPNKVFSYREGTDLHIDRPWMATDTSGGPYNGWIYVVSKSISAAPLPHHIWIKSSPDGGVTWTAPKMMDDSIPSGQVTNSMGTIAVGKDGNVYVAYASYYPSMNSFARMICSKSVNGAALFTPYVLGIYASNSAVTDSLYQGSYVLSASPVNASKLVFTFTDNRNGDPDILSVNSSDGGQTWTSNPVRVNDDALSNGKGQDMCWAAYSPNGTYGVFWRDRRNGTNNDLSNYEIFTSLSFNDGMSFSPNTNLSTAPSPYVNMKKGNDFMGIGLSNSTLFVDWCDARTGNNEIFTTHMALSALAGIQEKNQDQITMGCFPNPNPGDLTLRFNLSNPCLLRVSVYSADGRISRNLPAFPGKEGVNELPLSLRDLPAGHYFLRLNGDNIHGEAAFDKTNL